MKYQVIIPTHNRSDIEIINIVKNINAQCDVLIVNQTSNDSITKKIINENNVTVINISNIGVAKNRNNLLRLATGDILICTDDDCPLVDNYISILDKEFTSEKEAILFAGIVTHENNRLTHTKSSRKVTKYNDVSFAGGPGLVLRRSIINKYSLYYDESVGYPNYIYLGEDSLFLKSLVDKNVEFYLSSTILFTIKDDIDNSVYFKGIDEQFVISRGYITRKLHPISYKIYFIRYAKHMYHYRNNHFSKVKLYYLLIKGSKYKNNK